MVIPQKIHFGLYAVLMAIPVLTGCQRASFQDATDFRLREGDLLFHDLDCGVNGGVKVSHLAEQKCTTGSLSSRDRPGCQYSILTSSFLLPG